MIDLPPGFIEQMQCLLGDEFSAFLDTYRRSEPIGLRANTLKISPAELRSRMPEMVLQPLLWTQDAFQVSQPLASDIEPPGKHPYHAAGLYYLQEPSAMFAAEALIRSAPLRPGECILDLCAAPGGKSTHLAALLNDSGLLVVNETHSRRVWELVENLERWGTHKAVVLNETPHRLAERLSGSFDRILVDAPCSGEAMFRKSEAARRDWSTSLVHSCAVRQSSILDEAVRLLRPGGLLAYSTCTFNTVENEEVLNSLLVRFPYFEPVSLAFFHGGKPGASSFPGAVRLWPHHAPGNGHFVAVLRHLPDDEIEPRRKNLRRAEKRRGDDLTAYAEHIYLDFCKQNLLMNPLKKFALRLKLAGSRLYAVSPDVPNLDGLKVIHPGWWLGTIETSRTGEKRFEPSHSLALGLTADSARMVVELKPGSPDTRAYLHGETLHSEGDNGWVLVCIDGFPLGWGRRNQGIVKNFYPKGLRQL